MSADETVTTCAGCGMNRYCRKYKDIWLCLSGAWRCWKHREAVYANHRNKEDKSCKSKT